jgi:hypothetical protein
LQANVKDITRTIHQAETALASAPEVVLKPDGTWAPFTGGRLAGGASKVAVLGTLPKTIQAATGLPRTARLANGTRRGAARARGRTGV